MEKIPVIIYIFGKPQIARFNCGEMAGHIYF
jgi:hypothetical protein